MPLPKPTKKESKKDFIERCMSDDKVSDEFGDSKQRYAVCQTQWKDSKAEKESKGHYEIDYSEQELENEKKDLIELFGCESVALEILFAAKFSDEEKDEIYKKYHDNVNMSYSQLKKWSENPCSKAASLSRAPINRNLRLLSKKKADWTNKDYTDANKTIAFISRMKKVEKGEPVKIKVKGEEKTCPSKRDISLKNWAYNP